LSTARQAHNTEAERRACEIRLRVERKAGQLLAKREKARASGSQHQERSRDTADHLSSEVRPSAQHSKEVEHLYSGGRHAVGLGCQRGAARYGDQLRILPIS
jgi:hypothetical protein